LPHIEKRFNLSGFDSGMIAASNDVPAVIFGLFVAHWGHFGNKVRWIGFGGIVTGTYTFKREEISACSGLRCVVDIKPCYF
jgi:hypothetical protein